MFETPLELLGGQMGRGEFEGGASEPGEITERTCGGVRRARGGGDDLGPEGLFLQAVEQDTVIAACNGDGAPKGAGPLGPGKDGGRLPGEEAAAALAPVEAVAEGAGGVLRRHENGLSRIQQFEQAGDVESSLHTFSFLYAELHRSFASEIAERVENRAELFRFGNGLRDVVETDATHEKAEDYRKNGLRGGVVVG